MGRIAGHFGVAGEVKVDALDAGAFVSGRAVVIDDGVARRETTIGSVRAHQQRLLVRFAGIEDADAARALAGSQVLVERSALETAKEGEFRTADLVGFEVRDARIGSLGVVRDVRRYPACDMLVVGEQERLIPMLRAYGFAVDAKREVIEVSLPPGFEEL